MIALLGILAFHFLVLLVGKNTKETNYQTYIYVAFLSLLIVGVLLFYMFNHTLPASKIRELKKVF